jgi:hypothetical protein
MTNSPRVNSGKGASTARKPVAVVAVSARDEPKITARAIQSIGRYAPAA